MGSVARVIKRVTKSVTKPVSKAFKSVAKGILKVGKATMRGIAKVSNKLGPIGSIALAIAMPYALGGLSTMTTAAMNSNSLFLQSIGNVGNAIRTSYNAFNLGIKKGFNTITKSITKSFSNFAPKGSNNIFSRISKGARDLYKSAKATMKKYTPKVRDAKGGSVEFFGVGDPGVGVMSSTDAASALQRGTLKASELGKQTLSESGGWFTRANSVGTQADKYVTETINNAYKERLNGFGSNATRMFTDVKNQALELGTYTNDEAIGSFVENNSATKQLLSPDYKISTNIEDLTKTKDYISNGQGGYKYTGDETFKQLEIPKKNLTSIAKKSLLGLKDKLLADTPKVESNIDMTLMGSMTNDSTFANASYGSTDIKGTAGGNFIAKVFGEAASNQAKNYYKNMNLLV